MYEEDAPEDPDTWTLPKMKKLSFLKEYDAAKIIFVNYQYKYSYNHILTKLISLVPVMPPTL